MVVIEIKKSLRDSAILVFILLVIVAGMAVSEKDPYLMPSLELFLALYASFAGWSLFERERQDGAMEYLLALPISRLRLLALKLAPRLIAVALILFGYGFIHRQYSVHALLPYFTFACLYVGVFLLSVSLSLSMKSFIGTFFITLFLTVGLYSFLTWLDPSISNERLGLQTVLSLATATVLFALRFRRFDIRPLSHFNRRYVPVLVLLLAVVFTLTYITTRSRWGHFYLTEEGYLLSDYGHKTVIETMEGGRTVFDQGMAPLLQADKTLLVALGRSGGEGDDLAKLNLETMEIEKRWDLPAGYWFHRFLENRASVDGRPCFLLTGPHHRRYQILELNGETLRFIPVQIDFGDEMVHQISGTIENPVRFVLFTGTRLFLMEENGHGEMWMEARGVTSWKNRLLVFGSSRTVLFEFSPEPKPVLQIEGKVRKIWKKWSGDIDDRVLVLHNDVYELLDLEKGSLQKITAQDRPYHYATNREGNLRIVWLKRDEITVSEWVQDRLRVEATWYTRIEGLKLTRVFPAGVVVYGRAKREVFRFDPPPAGLGDGK